MAKGTGRQECRNDDGYRGAQGIERPGQWKVVLVKIEISKNHSRNSIKRAEGPGAMSSRKERECPHSVVDDSHRHGGRLTPDSKVRKSLSLFLWPVSIVAFMWKVQLSWEEGRS